MNTAARPSFPALLPGGDGRQSSASTADSPNFNHGRAPRVPNPKPDQRDAIALLNASFRECLLKRNRNRRRDRVARVLHVDPKLLGWKLELGTQPLQHKLIRLVRHDEI